MKRILFTTAILLSVLSSCQKETSSVQNESEPIVFTARIAEPSATKVSVDCTGGKVSWVAGDSIFISNGSETKTYIADQSGATTTFSVKESSKPAFTEAARYTATYGAMPAPGVDQKYSDTPGALVYMEAPQTEITTTPDFTFDVKCGLLKLNLTATGKSIKCIYVSDGTNTYSLVCETAQSIETATDFYIALPAGGYTKYIIRDSEGYEAVKTAKLAGTEIAVNQINKVTFSKLVFKAPKYTEGSYTGDGIMIGSIWWAPVNCGYDATNYKYGKLYQWGRAVGGGYYNNDAGGVYQDAIASAPSGKNTNPIDTVFYKSVDLLGDWYTISEYNQLGGWPMKSWDAGYVAGKIANPCPAGWRVPTYDELNSLIGNSGGSSIGTGGWDSTNQGYWFNGTTSPAVNSGMFLPAAGYRNYANGDAMNRSSYGSYWSSSVKDNDARYLIFRSTIYSNMYDGKRAGGYSVRCVQN